MPRFLTLYLAWTGVGAFIALAMPGLVMLGLFMLILPGLILGIMPTAFMYGVIFTVGFLAARAIFGDGVISIIAGLAFLVLVITTIPQPTRAADIAAYKASILPAVTPAKPIELKGDIRFNFNNPSMNKSSGPYVKGRSGYRCDSYCLAALFTPGVTSVTIDKSGLDDLGKPSIEARTYRLVARPDCRSNYEVNFDNITAPLRTNSKPGVSLFDDSKVLVSDWAMRLANEFCVVMEVPVQNHHFTITELISNGSGGPYRGGNWKFGSGRIDTQTLTIHQGKDLVFREHRSSVTTLAKVLLIGFAGDLTNPHFRWERATLYSGDKYGSVDLQKSMGDFTNLAGKPVDGSSRKENAAAHLPAYRAQMLSALNDPSLSEKSPAFKVMESYFAAISDKAAPEDVEILSRLFSDTRITRYEGAWNLRLPAEHMIPIYNAYTKRIIAEGAPSRFQKSLMSNAVAKMGTDTFKLIGPDQIRLLNNPSWRLAVPELVRALGYGGLNSGRTLIQYLKQHAGAIANIDRMRKNREVSGYGLQEQRDANMTLIGAAQRGLCIMAPRDPALLNELDEFLRSGAMPRYLVTGHNQTDWDVLLVRMGKPVASLEKPESMSGTAAKHQDLVRQRAQRWKPEDCDRM
jgi:hypothetical protein